VATSPARRRQIFFFENGGPTSDPHLLDAEGTASHATNPRRTTDGAARGEHDDTTIRQRAKVIEVIDGDTSGPADQERRSQEVRLID
jgi:hypothetical protein